MSVTFAITDMQRGLPHGHFSNTVDNERNEYDSTPSGEVNDSRGDGAPDLEVEASPPQRDDVDGAQARDDVDASFFSDYEAQTHGTAFSEAIVASPRHYSAHRATQRSRDAAPNLESREHESKLPLSSEGDGFYDAEYASSLIGLREMPPPSPSPSREAVLSCGKERALALLTHPTGCVDSWLDPLHSLSSPPADTASDNGRPGRLLHAPHGLSESPQRGSHLSRSAPHSDTPSFYGGPPSETARGGTAAPSLGRDVVHPVNTNTAQPAVCVAPVNPVVSPAAAAYSAQPPPCSQEQVSHSVPEKAGRAAKAPSPPLPSPPQSYRSTVYVSPSPDRAVQVVNSPPPRKPVAEIARFDIRGGAPTVMVAQVPGLHALPTSIVTGAAGPQKRVVRELAPRGVPLLLQCTQHAKTPTRTVVIQDMAVRVDGYESNGEAAEETVDGGQHTSAFKETSGLSDLITSSSLASSVAPAKNRVSGRAGRHTPERVAHRRRRTARSRSPLFSLVNDGRHPGSVEAFAARQPRSSPHSSCASSTSSCAFSAAPPALVDFSVHTESLGRSAQDDSLVLRSYSVESLAMSAEAGGGVGYCPALSASSGTAPPHGTPYAAADRSRPHSSSAVLRNTAPSCIPLPRNANTSLSEFVADRPVLNEATRSVPKRSERVRTVLKSEENKCKNLWPSRELVYPAPVVKRVAVPSSRGPPQDLGIQTMIESVEEAAVGAGSKLSATSTGGFGYHQDTYGTQRTFRATQAFRRSVDAFSTISASPALVSAYKTDVLQRRQQQREAVRQLLARQTDPQDRPSSHAHRRNDSTVAALSVTAPQRYSPAAYVAQQEQFREQRAAAEAEQLRLGLALDVCLAVRPFGRDLLLMFLLLVEESNAVRQRRKQVLSSTRGGSCGSQLDAGMCGESRVNYDTCAEAVNCVLERHGVSWIRATRELCRRVVGWCHHRSQASASEEASFVEYTTFVSCVMEFAAQFPSQAL